MPRPPPPSVLLVALLMALSGLSGLLLAPTTAAADDATYKRLMERATGILREAESLTAAGRTEAARAQARRAAALIGQADRLRPGDTAAAFLGVQAAVFAGDATAARQWIARYAKRTPYGERDPNLHYARAMTLLLLAGRPADAAKSLDRMAEVSRGSLTRPANVLRYRALTEWARSLADAGQGDEAVRQFRRASDVARRLGDPAREAAARANGAITLLESGRPKDAEALLTRLHAQHPANPVFAYHLGRSLRLLGRHDEAVRVLGEAAAAVDQGRVEARHAALLHRAHLERGIALRLQAEASPDPARRTSLREEGRLAFERYTVLEPRVAEGWHRLGRLLVEDLQRPLDAIAPLEQARTLDPVCDGALRLLLRIADRQGPPEGSTAEAWAKRGKAWAKDLATNANEWAEARDQRRRRSRTGEDGCP